MRERSFPTGRMLETVARAYTICPSRRYAIDKLCVCVSVCLRSLADNYGRTNGAHGLITPGTGDGRRHASHLVRRRHRVQKIARAFRRRLYFDGVLFSHGGFARVFDFYVSENWTSFSLTQIY